MQGLNFELMHNKVVLYLTLGTLRASGAAKSDIRVSHILASPPAEPAEAPACSTSLLDRPATHTIPLLTR